MITICRVIFLFITMRRFYTVIPPASSQTLHSLLSLGSPRNSCETLLFRELNFFPVSRRKLAKFWTSEPERASEGWPLLNVETEANGVSWNKNERGPSLVGSLGSSCWYNRFLSCLGCSSQPSTNVIFLTERFFTLWVPVAQKPGQAVVLGRQSLFLCAELTHKQHFCEIFFGFQRITSSEFAKIS